MPLGGIVCGAVSPRDGNLAMTTYLFPGDWDSVGLEVIDVWKWLAMASRIGVHVCARVVRPRELRQRMSRSSQRSAEEMELLRAKSPAMDLECD